MEKIPAQTLKEILALRSENGLQATEAAFNADLAKSKAKWTLEETPRYRRAGRSPLFVSGKYLTATGACPATGEKEEGGKKAATRAINGTKATRSSTETGIDQKAFYKVLHGKGFAVKLSQNLLTGELESEVPPAIAKLGLKFGAIPANAAEIHVTQTSPQVQVSMTLDKLLELAGIKP